MNTAGDRARETYYSLRRARELLGLSRAMMDGLVHAGFVNPERGPRREYRFSFQDLLLLRTAQALQAARIAPRAIVRALSNLKAKLPAALPLSGLRIRAVGTDVAVRDRAGVLEAASGQLLFDFDVAPDDAGANVVFIDRRVPLSPDADACFELGESLESVDVEAAEAAYRRAIELQPQDADAYLNLGALLCDAQRCAAAVALYDDAVRHCPEVAPVHYNRAIALEDQQRVDEAIAAYQRSVQLDPAFADAHFNLARLQEQSGDARAAVRHLNAYRRLQRG